MFDHLRKFFDFGDDSYSLKIQTQNRREEEHLQKIIRDESDDGENAKFLKKRQECQNQASGANCNLQFTKLGDENVLTNELVLPQSLDFW